MMHVACLLQAGIEEEYEQRLLLLAKIYQVCSGYCWGLVAI
jgi:hypothetical protein